MVTKNMPVNKLKFWKNNPRKNDSTAEKLAELIKLYGIRSPLVVWEKNMTVYKGNATLKAIKLLGMKEVPVVLAKFKSEQEAVAYGLADNKASEWADWDAELLQSIFTGGQFPDNSTGFTDKEIAGFTSAKVETTDTMSETVDDEQDVKATTSKKSKEKVERTIISIECNLDEAVDLKTTLITWMADSGFTNLKVK